MKSKISKTSHKISYNAQAKCQKLESFFGAGINVSPKVVSLAEPEIVKE